jgi:hypothetical protein
MSGNQVYPCGNNYVIGEDGNKMMGREKGA